MKGRVYIGPMIKPDQILINNSTNSDLLSVTEFDCRMTDIEILNNENPSQIKQADSKSFNQKIENIGSVLSTSSDAKSCGYIRNSMNKSKK